MRNETKTKIKDILIMVTVIVLIIFAISQVVIYYFSTFGELGDQKSDWGTFGDFIGGTLNPLLSFISFMALLYTIFIQREQLNSQKKQFEQSIKLSALMAIWQEDKNKIVRNDESIANFKKEDDLHGCFDIEDYALNNKCTEQNKILKSRREIIFTEIEKILRDSGVAIPEMPMD